jgi:hypothetical protein
MSKVSKQELMVVEEVKSEEKNSSQDKIKDFMEDIQVSKSEKKLGNIFSQLEVDELPEQEQQEQVQEEEDTQVKISTELPDSLKGYKKKKSKQLEDFENITKQIEQDKVEIQKEEVKVQNITENIITKITKKINLLEEEFNEELAKEKEYESEKFVEILMKYDELYTQQMLKLDILNDEEFKVQRKEQINRLHKLCGPIDKKLAEYKNKK